MTDRRDAPSAPNQVGVGFKRAFGGCLGVLAALFGLAVLGSLLVSQRADSPSSSHSNTCAPGDFTISNVRATTEYSYAHLTGAVVNNCEKSAGPRLKWTAYNSDHTVAFSNDFWPASTVNIAPHASYPFETMNSAPRGQWTYTVQVIGVDHW
jgi:hypothetical protein